MTQPSQEEREESQHDNGTRSLELIAEERTRGKADGCSLHPGTCLTCDIPLKDCPLEEHEPIGPRRGGTYSFGGFVERAARNVEICKLATEGIATEKLAAQFSLCRWMIRHIIRAGGCSARKCTITRLAIRDKEICRLRREKKSVEEIAVLFELTPGNIYHIVRTRKEEYGKDG